MTEKTQKKTRGWLKWGAAVCLCLAVAGGAAFFALRPEADIPQPEAVRVGNPLVQVASAEEMERMLDFRVPLLDKEVERYVVLVIDGYPTIGRVHYKDGGVFNIRYGSGDVSGIYGGKEQSAQQIGDVRVTYYSYEETRYALWETDGFTCSLTGTGLEAEVAQLLGGGK